MSLLKTTVKGVAWTSVSTIVRSVASLLQIAVLTRVLEKSDFGLVAIASLFLSFTQIFMDIGISAGIMHFQTISKKQYSSLFWLNVMFGSFLTLVLCALSPFIAKFYSDAELVKIVCLLSTTIVFTSLGSQHRTVQQKKLRFKTISLVEIISAVFSLLMAIFLAFADFGVYSIVYANIFNAAITGLSFLTIGLIKDNNISFHFKLFEVKPFLKIGVFSVGTQVLDFISREIDIIIIGASMGKDVVGLYSLCKKIVQTLYQAVNPIIMKVLAPIFALLQTEKERLRGLYMDTVESIAIINYPIYFLVAIFSLGILNFMYGGDYNDGTLVLSFTALLYGLNTTGNPVGSLQVAVGRTDSGFYWTIVRILIVFISVYVGSRFNDINILAFVLLLVPFLSSFPFWRITIKPLIGGSYSEYFRITIGHFFIILLFSIPFYLLFSRIISVLLCIMVGLVYVIAYVILGKLLFKKSYLYQIVREKISPYIKN